MIVRTACPTAVLLVSLWGVAMPAAGAAEAAPDAPKAPQLNAAKYPQDTPQKALESLIQALETKDLSYWIAFLIAPADTKRLVEKHGSLEGAANANADERRSARLKAQLEVMRKMAGKPPEEGEENGVKFARYQVDQKVLQLEKQADGRWCMNIRVSRKPAEGAK